ncbi:SRPBCC domain-containing protein [Dyadobacter sp. CY343]|uniref:SRPBCC family protein n=1 Tax=Dyadobacter sp. CY343 TaxID=2907299 RepID=UPI001F2CD827|nr:SRPBCC domain-containing protein [Dyadobacter sp. CY343]MCE7059278.1 SRPBCC domain-containing protein [Dyadobacter sp. CY343]
MDQNSNVLEIERGFDVDVATLFAAWTEAEHLKKWWKPMGETITGVKNELREGGAVEYYVGDADLEITGTYSEVVPGEKLVYTWVWNMNDEGSESGYTLHIAFTTEGEGSRLRVVQEGFSGPEFLSPHQEGWEKGLNDLASYLSSNGDNTESAKSQEAESETSTSENANQAENAHQIEAEAADQSGGYDGLPEQAKVGGG